MKIQQHIYTRERRGLYSHTGGYDSIAKSAGLCDEFVKNQLHPYCIVSAPKGDKALTVINYPCGRMLLGQTIHMHSDFTGQRAAYFVHNYVLPPDMAGLAVKDMGRLIMYTTFLESYDISLGGELPELDKLPASSKEFDMINQDDEPAIDLIIHSLMQSVCGGKKTYVATPTQYENISTLLYELYQRMPLELRHVLGFCTYVREPVNRSNLHLMFIEKKRLPQRMTDFVIDLSDLKANHDNPSHNNKDSFLGKLVAARTANLTPKDMAQEMDFWRLRFQEACSQPCFKQAIHLWADRAIDRLQKAELIAIPKSLIQWGKLTDNPIPYVLLEILCRAIKPDDPLSKSHDLRYHLGSYRLDSESCIRVKKNIDRLHSKENAK